jgi:hypothetical protein
METSSYVSHKETGEGTAVLLNFIMVVEQSSFSGPDNISILVSFRSMMVHQIHALW